MVNLRYTSSLMTSWLVCVVSHTAAGFSCLVYLEFINTSFLRRPPASPPHPHPPATNTQTFMTICFPTTSFFLSPVVFASYSIIYFRTVLTLKIRLNTKTSFHTSSTCTFFVSLWGDGSVQGFKKWPIKMSIWYVSSSLTLPRHPKHNLVVPFVILLISYSKGSRRFHF